LEALADPGGICVSKTAFDHIETKLPLGYEFLGEQEVKNIAKPIGAYRVLMDPRVTVAGAKAKSPKVPLWRHKAVLVGSIVVLVAVIGVGVWNFYWRAPKIEPASKERMALEWPDKPSIAVLPFSNMSKDRDHGYIAEGLTENIITSLSQIPKIFVIARNSVLAYRGKPVKVQQVAEELAVQYVLEGSVQTIEDRVRINVQLVDAFKGYHLWSKRYDRKIENIFDLQDEITLNIAILISGELGEGEEARARHRSTNSLDAWSYAIKSLPAVGPQKDINKEAKENLIRALEIDPKYAWAWSRLALIYYWEYMFGFSASPEESLRSGFEAAQKAISLDENLPEAHVTLALLLLYRNQYDQALAESKRGVSLGPNNSDNLARAVQVMYYCGMFEECLALIKKAIRLDPHHGTVHLYLLGNALRCTGRYEEAISIFKRIVVLRKGTYGEFLPHVWLATVYGELNRLEEANFHVKSALDIKPDSSIQYILQSQPFKNPEDKERLAAGMRKVGFPEK
jgi:adenylate cyclase